MKFNTLCLTAFLTLLTGACTSQPKTLTTKQVSSTDGEIVRSSSGTPLQSHFYQDMEPDASMQISDNQTPQEPVLTPELDEVTVQFQVNGTSLNQDQLKQIDAQLSALSANDEIEIVGFADPSGDYDYNMNLSKTRAENVRRYLAEKGIDVDKMKAIGAGELDTAKRSEARVVKIRIR